MSFILSTYQIRVSSQIFFFKYLLSYTNEMKIEVKQSLFKQNILDRPIVVKTSVCKSEAESVSHTFRLNLMSKHHNSVVIK